MHLLLPKLLKFPWGEGDIKAVQCILDVPSPKNSIALIIRLYEILQWKMVFSNMQNSGLSTASGTL